ncbi:MAG: trehalase family glycosidase [Verrucomicrobiae bacterium]|nr:trehalase family glycosidase [Verrucomicrobiae bacterium]MDW8343382.1 trehalase family glycosidase [Verrucomicrobiae bacterium]
MSAEYDAVQRRLARGWNTWNTRSVLAHVWLPGGLEIGLGYRDYVSRQYLRDVQIGRRGAHEEQARPGLHAYDGAYTELTVAWQNTEFRVESMTEGEELILLVTPTRRHPEARRAPLIVAEGGLLWNRPGHVERVGDRLRATLPGRTVEVFASGPVVREPHIPVNTPYLAVALDGPVCFSTGRRYSAGEAAEAMQARRGQFARRFEKYGRQAEVYKAIQSVMAWNTIYEPAGERVITPVSRMWNTWWGGFVLFEWDTYFAALLAAQENRDLAYANAVEMTRAATADGFVPNFVGANDCVSRDRSEPPVGSWVCAELYRRFGERWFLEEVYPGLLRWNRWWAARRMRDGLLCWGSNPYEPVLGMGFETRDVNCRQGAVFESGLDNCPVYEGVPFNAETHLLEMQDAGLSGLYAWDCEALAGIATTLGRAEEARELRERAAAVRARLATLWDETRGIYLNRRTDTGELCPRLAPFAFYPLLARAATPAQARRMVTEHFYNPAEFWGEWIMPSIARNDPSFAGGTYWAGRIWGPMNFLVYLGLCQYDLPEARRDLAEKSRQLLLKEWRDKGHVHENYNAVTGEGCDVDSSQAFYHWGGLLGLPALIEEEDADMAASSLCKRSQAGFSTKQSMTKTVA